MCLIFVIVFSGLNLKQSIDDAVRKSGVETEQFGDLPAKMGSFLVKAKSDSTNAKYMTYFKRWEAFITSKGGSAVPASPVHVALFLTEMMDKKQSFNVISSTVYSIKWAHSLRDLPDPTDNLFVKNLVEASKRTLLKPVCKKEPISADALVTLCTKYSGTLDIVILRDLSMILIAFSGVLRFDELVHLRCSDVSFYDNHLTLNIRKSKTDQYRQGNEVVISKGSTAACPYVMLKKYMDVAKLATSGDTFLYRACYRSRQTCGLTSKNYP